MWKWIKIIKFDNTETQNSEIYQNKSLISTNNIDINKTVVSNKVCFSKDGFKYFGGYKDAKTIRPLRIFPIKMSTYRRDFDKTICISFIDKIWKTV